MAASLSFLPVALLLLVEAYSVHWSALEPWPAVEAEHSDAAPLPRSHNPQEL
jgi:hypothetical protein